MCSSTIHSVYGLVLTFGFLVLPLLASFVPELLGLPTVPWNTESFRIWKLKDMFRIELIERNLFLISDRAVVPRRGEPFGSMSQPGLHGLRELLLTNEKRSVIGTSSSINETRCVIG